MVPEMEFFFWPIKCAHVVLILLFLSMLRAGHRKRELFILCSLQTTVYYSPSMFPHRLLSPSSKRKKMEHKNKRSYASVLVSNSQKKPSSTTTQSPVTTRSSMPSSSSTLSSKAAHFSHQFNSFSIIYTCLLAYKKLTVIFFLCPLRSPTSKDFINRTCSCGKIFFN